MSQAIASPELTDDLVAKPFPTNSSKKSVARHVLEFEKPLAQLENQIHELEAMQAAKQVDYSKELRQLRSNYTSLLRKTYEKLSAWETVQVARHPQRPLFRDYVDMICREFRELHGDRRFGDDRAIQCGLARLGGHKVMLIGYPQGPRYQGKGRLLLRPGPPRGLPQGAAVHEAGREIRHPGRDVD
jgi:acetyl-CoA carboxylase carboxyl transferase subunit alpha